MEELKKLFYKYFKYNIKKFQKAKPKPCCLPSKPAFFLHS